MAVVLLRREDVLGEGLDREEEAGDRQRVGHHLHVLPAGEVKERGVDVAGREHRRAEAELPPRAAVDGQTRAAVAQQQEHDCRPRGHGGHRPTATLPAGKSALELRHAALPQHTSCTQPRRTPPRSNIDTELLCSQRASTKLLARPS